MCVCVCVFITDRWIDILRSLRAHIHTACAACAARTSYADAMRSAERHFKLLSEAYATLSDASKRRDYDSKHMMRDAADSRSAASRAGKGAWTYRGFPGKHLRHAFKTLSRSTHRDTRTRTTYNIQGHTYTYNIQHTLMAPTCRYT